MSHDQDEQMQQRIREWQWQQRIEVAVHRADGSVLGTAKSRKEFESLAGQVLSGRAKEVTLVGTVEGERYDGPVDRHAVFALIQHIETGNVPYADGGPLIEDWD